VSLEAQLVNDVNGLFINLQEGQGLISQNHYARKDISDQLERLEAAWKTLLASTQEKKERLQEAYQACISTLHLISWAFSL
jgi:spectrin beta